jgi:hypothetical protein
MKKVILCIALSLSSPLSAIVGSVLSGQSLWWMVKRIGQTSDIIQSKLDALKACEETVLTSADISGGFIIISAPATYRLGEDVAADISIDSSRVFLDLNNRIVTGGVTIQDANTDVSVVNGFIHNVPASSLVQGFFIGSNVERALVEKLTVTVDDSAVGIAGRPGIYLSVATDVQIIGCTIRGGGGGAGSPGSLGGHGIHVNSTRTLIRDCIIYSSGSGGDSSSGNGGNAGNGIHVDGATDVEIDGCTIMATGTGGNGAGGGNGGNGGDGIRVLSNCTDVAVHDCIIRNTGAGGTGSVAGTDGKAIFDSVITAGSLSVFLRNFAHNIANTIKYDFQAGGIEKGTLVANPPDNTALSEPNQFVNAYMS